MSSFAALMALSASQTRQSEAAVQSQLQERQKKEAAKRKAQEEKEAKECGATASVIFLKSLDNLGYFQSEHLALTVAHVG